MRFANFRAGQQITAGPYLVGEEEILAFARQYDPQWFHTDAAAAAQGPFEGLIASGWHTCAIAMRLAVEGALRGSESYASPGISGIRWPHPVRPGDALSLVATVLEVRRSRSGLGVLRWQWQLFNQRGTEVLDLESTSLFRLPVQDANPGRCASS
ncbi:MaoC family dehydratase [Ramlibacter sp. AN1133]|uniref:MaoC family dehydratase n=1 Tax=Ramlibacter sp. AN1133 TaxID=3133429 RepID=UPI0030BDEF01